MASPIYPPPAAGDAKGTRLGGAWGAVIGASTPPLYIASPVIASTAAP